MGKSIISGTLVATAAAFQCATNLSVKQCLNNTSFVFHEFPPSQFPLISFCIHTRLMGNENEINSKKTSQKIFLVNFLRYRFVVRNARHQVSGREIRVNPVVHSWQTFYTPGQKHFENHAAQHFCTFPTTLPSPDGPIPPWFSHLFYFCWNWYENKYKLAYAMRQMRMSATN